MFKKYSVLTFLLPLFLTGCVKTNSSSLPSSETSSSITDSSSFESINSSESISSSSPSSSSAVAQKYQLLDLVHCQYYPGTFNVLAGSEYTAGDPVTITYTLDNEANTAFMLQFNQTFVDLIADKSNPKVLVGAFLMPATDVVVAVINKSYYTEASYKVSYSLTDSAYDDDYCVLGFSSGMKFSNSFEIWTKDGYAVSNVTFTADDSTSSSQLSIYNGMYFLPLVDCKTLNLLITIVEASVKSISYVGLDENIDLDKTILPKKGTVNSICKLYIYPKDGYKISTPTISVDGTTLSNINNYYYFTMPDSDVTITSAVTPLDKITCSANSLILSAKYYSDYDLQEEITQIDVTRKSQFYATFETVKGYGVKDATITSDTSAYCHYINDKDAFLIGNLTKDADIVLSINAVATHTVSFTSVDNLTFSFYKNLSSSYIEGRNVCFTLAVADSYLLTDDSLTIKDSSNTVIEYSYNSEKKYYYFSMPDSAVSISASVYLAPAASLTVDYATGYTTGVVSVSFTSNHSSYTNLGTTTTGFKVGDEVAFMIVATDNTFSFTLHNATTDSSISLTEGRSHVSGSFTLTSTSTKIEITPTTKTAHSLSFNYSDGITGSYYLNYGEESTIPASATSIDNVYSYDKVRLVLSSDAGTDKKYYVYADYNGGYRVSITANTTNTVFVFNTVDYDMSIHISVVPA